MDWKLEVVPVPITDVDRAKHFYSDPDGNGWVLQEGSLATEATL
jgi:hypothetical protein